MKPKQKCLKPAWFILVLWLQKEIQWKEHYIYFVNYNSC